MPDESLSFYGMAQFILPNHITVEVVMHGHSSLTRWLLGHQHKKSVPCLKPRNRKQTCWHMADENFFLYLLMMTFVFWYIAFYQSNHLQDSFTDIIHLVYPIHDTGNGPCSSLNMHILTQLLIFAFWSFLRPFFKLEPSNLVQLGHLTD